MTDASSAVFSPSELHSLCVNTIRFLSIDAVQLANSGHPGMPMGAAPMAYVLWMGFLKHNPSNPQWFDRDRFVLSAGHGSMLLYSLLYLPYSHKLPVTIPPIIYNNSKNRPAPTNAGGERLKKDR